eukprot:scaffold19202_cov121-Isochrysis_galbana.AAC.2
MESGGSAAPPSHRSMACITGRALSSTSSHSSAGCDCVTMAPPAPRDTPCADSTAVRITTFRSDAPCTEKKPSAPE